MHVRADHRSRCWPSPTVWSRIGRAPAAERTRPAVLDAGLESSGGGTRTHNPSVNSRMLCRLSYPRRCRMRVVLPAHSSSEAAIERRRLSTIAWQFEHSSTHLLRLRRGRRRSDRVTPWRDSANAFVAGSRWWKCSAAERAVVPAQRRTRRRPPRRASRLISPPPVDARPRCGSSAAAEARRARRRTNVVSPWTGRCASVVSAPAGARRRRLREPARPRRLELVAAAASAAPSCSETPSRSAIARIERPSSSSA